MPSKPFTRRYFLERYVGGRGRLTSHHYFEMAVAWEKKTCLEYIKPHVNDVRWQSRLVNCLKLKPYICYQSIWNRPNLYCRWCEGSHFHFGAPAGIWKRLSIDTSILDCLQDSNNCTKNHQKFQVPNMQESWTLSGYFGGWIFPYIGLAYSLQYIGEYLHFCYLKRLVILRLSHNMFGMLSFLITTVLQRFNHQQ